MKRRYAHRNGRTSRRSQGAQAVLEMAMILPIMLALVFNFLGVMVEVKDQNQLQTAVSLAAQSTLTAPVFDPYDGCIVSYSAFWSTVYGAPVGAPAPGVCVGASGYTAPSTQTCTTCGNFSSMMTAPAGSAMRVQAPGITCISVVNGSAPLYLSAQNYPAAAGSPPPTVRCSATVAFNFNNSPLGVFVLWTPTFTARADAVPTTVRQCQAVRLTCP